MQTPDEQAWQSVLRARGQRLTPQRELVLAAVDRLGHGTPEEIHAEVSGHTAAISLSTVYRNLALLEELGVVRVVHLGDRVPTYHSMSLPAHVHLTCSHCDRVIDASPREFEALVDSLAGAYGFEVDLDKLVLVGRCSECRQGPPASSTTRHNNGALELPEGS